MSEKNPESWEKPEEAEAPYSLEDILNEFGGWSRHTEPEEPVKPEEPKKPEPCKAICLPFFRPTDREKRKKRLWTL